MMPLIMIRPYRASCFAAARPPCSRFTIGACRLLAGSVSKTPQATQIETGGQCSVHDNEAAGPDAAGAQGTRGHLHWQQCWARRRYVPTYLRIYSSTHLVCCLRGQGSQNSNGRSCGQQAPIKKRPRTTANVLWDAVAALSAPAHALPGAWVGMHVQAAASTTLHSRSTPLFITFHSFSSNGPMAPTARRKSLSVRATAIVPRHVAGSLRRPPQGGDRQATGHLPGLPQASWLLLLLHAGWPCARPSAREDSGAHGAVHWQARL